MNIDRVIKNDKKKLNLQLKKLRVTVENVKYMRYDKLKEELIIKFGVKRCT